MERKQSREIGLDLRCQPRIIQSPSLLPAFTSLHPSKTQESIICIFSFVPRGLCYTLSHGTLDCVWHQFCAERIPLTEWKIQLSPWKRAKITDICFSSAHFKINQLRKDCFSKPGSFLQCINNVWFCLAFYSRTVDKSTLQWVNSRDSVICLLGNKNCMGEGRNNVYIDYKKISYPGKKHIYKDKEDYYNDRWRRVCQ